MLSARTVLAALTAISLAWAYVATHRSAPSGGATGSAAAVWDVGVRDVSRLRYSHGESNVEIRTNWEQDGDKPYLWIRVEEPPPTPARAPRSKPQSPQQSAPRV